MTSLPLTYIDAAATASLEPDDQPLQTSYLATCPLTLIMPAGQPKVVLSARAVIEICVI